CRARSFWYHPLTLPMSSSLARHRDGSRRRSVRCALVIVALVGLVALPAPSPADTAASMARAQALFDEGIHLFNLGRYEDACPKFEASLALVAGVGTRGKLAECYEKLGRTASAWRIYGEVERLARRTGD